MNPDDRTNHSEDHPQTIKSEPDSRGGSAMFREQQEQANGADGELEERPEAQNQDGADEVPPDHVEGARTIGDAVGSSAGHDVGAGTPGDQGDLGGGDAQIVGEGAANSSYKPGQSRD